MKITVQPSLISLIHECFLNLYSCSYGLTFSDIEQLKSEHLVKDNNASLWIRKNQTEKTK